MKGAAPMPSGGSPVSRWHMVVLAATAMRRTCSTPIPAEAHSSTIIRASCPVMAAVSAGLLPSMEALIRAMTSPP